MLSLQKGWWRLHNMCCVMYRTNLADNTAVPQKNVNKIQRAAHTDCNTTTDLSFYSGLKCFTLATPHIVDFT